MGTDQESSRYAIFSNIIKSQGKLVLFIIELCYDRLFIDITINLKNMKLFFETGLKLYF